MATVEECAAALRKIAGRLDSADASVRGKVDDDRTIACHLSDLGVTFLANLHDGGLHDIAQGQAAPGTVTLTMTSDDLIALTDGQLNLAGAWATGRVKVNAGMRDLLKLRSFF